jgi:hypothetical protein
MADTRPIETLPSVPSGTTGDASTFQFKLNTVAIDLTSATIKIAWKRHNSNKIQATMSVSNGVTITNAIGGTIQIDEQIYDWKPGVYYADVDITLTGGKKLNYLRLKREITDNTGKDA